MGMIRTQIQITREQQRRLRRAARAQGVPVAELIRRLIDRGIESELPATEDRWLGAMPLVGAFHDSTGATDVAVEHDVYLEDAFR